MTHHDPRLPQLLADMRWYARPEQFVLAAIEAHDLPVVLRLLAGVTSPFFQLIAEPSTITLLLPETEWRMLRPAFARARVEQPMRVISFDLELPPDLVGFMALLCAALAAEHISLLAVCSYARDYLVVRGEELERALAAIGQLNSRVRREQAR
jgi:hypothetical protein